jgi:mRNA interferase MazF
MKRGEIWTGGGAKDYAGKPRPVVIIQDDRFIKLDSVTICLFTTNVIDARWFVL